MIDKTTTLENFTKELNSEQLDIFVNALVKIRCQSGSVRQEDEIKTLVNQLPQFREFSNYINL